MLELLNLLVIDKIFIGKKLSELSKMIYIQCLMNHFRDKEATVLDAYAFELLNSEIDDFEKKRANFHELHKSELVVLNGDVITFTNMWGQLIDRTRLVNKPKQGSTVIKVEDCEQIFLKHKTLYELCEMKHKLSEQQVTHLIKVFVKEQANVFKTYANHPEAIRHCTNWIGKNHNTQKSIPSETIKSKGKILGR